MRSFGALTLPAVVLAAVALTGCDLLPSVSQAPQETAMVDTSAVVEEAGATAASRPAPTPRRRTTSRGARAAAPAADTAAPARDTTPAAPPPPTAEQRARTTMASDLRRLAVAQSEYLANQGRYSSNLSRLGIRYIPHPGVSVQIIEGNSEGWAAVAVHSSFPEDRCGIWVGNRPEQMAAYVPSPNTPGCLGR